MNYLRNILWSSMETIEGTAVVGKFARACRDGDVPMARQLIDEGVDINGLHDGYTGLQHAIDHDKREIVNLLLTCPGIDVNARDAIGETALHFAVWEENTEVVRRILSRGDIRLDHGGITTVLHVACFKNMEEFVEMMLAHPGCNKDFVNRKNWYGETAETIAEKIGYHGCVRMIRGYLTRGEGQDDVDGARSRENSEALSSSELDAVIEDFEAVEVTFKEAANTRENQMRAEISGLENSIMALKQLLETQKQLLETKKQLLGEYESKSAADLAGIVKKKEDLKTLKRRMGFDPTPQTGPSPVQAAWKAMGILAGLLAWSR